MLLGVPIECLPWARSFYAWLLIVSRTVLVVYHNVISFKFP